MTDSKNTILAIVLSAIVLIAWQYFYAMPQAEKQKQQQLQAQLQAPKPAAQPGQTPAAPGATPAPGQVGQPVVPQGRGRAQPC